jgi:hypothetical protein
MSANEHPSVTVQTCKPDGAGRRFVVRSAKVLSTDTPVSFDGSAKPVNAGRILEKGGDHA